MFGFRASYSNLIEYAIPSYFQDRSNQVHTGLPNLQTEENLKKFLGIDSGESGVVWSLVAYSFGSLLATLPATLAFRKIGPAYSFAL